MAAYYAQSLTTRVWEYRHGQTCDIDICCRLSQCIKSLHILMVVEKSENPRVHCGLVSSRVEWKGITNRCVRRWYDWESLDCTSNDALHLQKCQSLPYTETLANAKRKECQRMTACTPLCWKPSITINSFHWSKIEFWQMRSVIKDSILLKSPKINITQPRTRINAASTIFPQ